jgi:dTMP kinase
VEHIIRPALAAGHVVLCDRFADSTLVYQGFVRGLPLDEVERLCRFAAGDLEPDRTILLDADPRDLLARREDRHVEDRLELEGLAFQEKVREGFLKLWRQHRDRIRRIDALQPADVITEEILATLK